MKELDYDVLIQDALRNVVKNALNIAATEGLEGDHHFYITFRTDRKDVTMPIQLREQHPDEVTIVIQHQFWDLKADDQKFCVTLSFHGKHEKLIVPYTALVSFMDPSVKFGLQFNPEYLEEDILSYPEPPATPSPKTPTGKGNVVTMDSFRKKK